MLQEFLQSIILGIVQGLSEFLPISSTAHLVVVPYFFNFKDPGLTFNVFLHLGTLVAIVSFFFKDWIKILKERSKLLWLIIIGTIPAGILGYFFESYIESSFRSPLIISFTLIIFAILLYLSDYFVNHKREIKEINWWQSVVIGIAQAIALIPGVSRSGVTMTAGLFLGLKRKDSAKFSFLLATPIMIGATLYRFRELFELEGNLFNGLSLGAAILGFVFALVAGYLAIKYLLKYLGRGSFLPFVIYRIVLAIIIIVVYLVRI